MRHATPEQADTPLARSPLREMRVWRGMNHIAVPHNERIFSTNFLVVSIFSRNFLFPPDTLRQYSRSRMRQLDGKPLLAYSTSVGGGSGGKRRVNTSFALSGKIASCLVVPLSRRSSAGRVEGRS